LGLDLARVGVQPARRFTEKAFVCRMSSGREMATFV
jgi:hypothetical protein